MMGQSTLVVLMKKKLQFGHHEHHYHVARKLIPHNH
jgi:hypothetical protein